MVETWGDVGAIFGVLVLASLVAGLIAGFIETWWDKRQRDKDKCQ